MRTTRIYTSTPLGSHAAVVLEPEPSHHLVRVLRLGVGDTLTVFDGCGGEYPCEITAVDKKHVQVRTGAHLPRECESPLAIHLGIAVSRGERMDWIVQKATELGVTALTPLVTEHNSVKLDAARAAKKIQHWQQVAISACEQCGRNRLPVVHAIKPLQQWLAVTDAERKFVLHHRAESAGLASVAGAAPHVAALLVGPEGGLSEAEITAAEQAGYAALRLGPRVLRTETAPLAVIAVLQACWGDMQPG